MNRNENIKKITSETESNWLEETEKKLANRGARKNARKLALQVLRLLREQNLTQTELAERMNVSRQQVSKIVKGQENFSFETVDKLEKALGVTLMTIGAPPEQFYHAQDFATGIQMAYSGNVTYILSKMERRAPDLTEALELYITKLACRQRAPLVSQFDLLDASFDAALNNRPRREPIYWQSLEVALGVIEMNWEQSQLYRVSESELHENCMS